jgi:hypothetical protein
MGALALVLFLLFYGPAEHVRSWKVVYGRGRAEVVSRATPHHGRHQEPTRYGLVEGIHVFDGDVQRQPEPSTVIVRDLVRCIQVVPSSGETVSAVRGKDVPSQLGFSSTPRRTHAYVTARRGGIIQLRLERTLWISAVPLHSRVRIPVQWYADMVRFRSDARVDELIRPRVDHRCDLRRRIKHWDLNEWVHAHYVDGGSLNSDRHRRRVEQIELDVEPFVPLGTSLQANHPVSRFQPLLIREAEISLRRSFGRSSSGVRLVAFGLCFGVGFNRHWQRSDESGGNNKHGNDTGPNEALNMLVGFPSVLGNGSGDAQRDSAKEDSQEVTQDVYFSHAIILLSVFALGVAVGPWLCLVFNRRRRPRRRE